jgi:molybdopterin converting factor small subunit
MTGTAVSTITVRVLLFGSYADVLGLHALELTIENPATVDGALRHLRSLPGGERLPARPLCAVNLRHVHPTARLSPGDELAILPPLAGG